MFTRVMTYKIARLWLELRRLPPITMGFAYKYSLLRKNHSTLQRSMLHTAAWGQRQGW